MLRSDRPDAHHRPVAAVSRRRPRSAAGWLGPLLQRLHFFAGLLVGPFVLVAALSGALYAATPQIEQAVYDEQLHVPATSTSLPLAEQVEIARAHVGGGARPSAVRPAPAPGDTTRVLFAEEGLGESESRAVFVDPGTGEVRGDLPVYGTSGSLPLRAWIDQLHRGLHLGSVGRLYSELAASWLWIVASAGAVRWAMHRRRSRPARPMPAAGSRSGYRRLLRGHTALGLGVLLGALFLSATGITWSQHAGENVTALRAALGWGTPAVATAIDASPGNPADEHAHHRGSADTGGHTGHGDQAGAGDEVADGAQLRHIDHVLETARTVTIDSDLVEILPPDRPGTAWVVQEIHRSHPTQVDQVAIDGASMTVVDRVDFAEYPVMAKLARWGVDLHMGTLFGVPNQVLLVLVALGIAAMVVLGYAMWWRRRPRRARGLAMGRAPRRGALAEAPWWGLLAVAAAAVGIGLLLPLVGWTLLGFLLLDTVLGLRHRRSRGSAPTGA